MPSQKTSTLSQKFCLFRLRLQLFFIFNSLTESVVKFPKPGRTRRKVSLESPGPPKAKPLGDGSA